MKNFVTSAYDRFLDGPDYLPVPSLVKRPGHYRSPTLAIAAWFSGLSRRCFTLPALLLWPVAMIASLYALVAIDSPVRLILLVFVALTAVELAVGLFFHPRLEIVRKAPLRVRAKTRFTITYELRNRRWIPAFDLNFDPFPFAGGIRAETPPQLARIGGSDRGMAGGEFIAPRRGVYPLYRPLAESRFPLGLCKWSWRSGNAELIRVHPDFTPLESFDFTPTGTPRSKKDRSLLARVGDSPELLGCRDYRDGDEVRHIDWAGSARRGRLVVKEFEREELRQLALVVDSYLPNAKLLHGNGHQSPQWENALRLTAAMSDYFMRTNIQIGLFATGHTPRPLRSCRGLNGCDAVADLLAEIEPEIPPKEPMPPPEFLAEIAKIGTAVLVLLHDDAPRQMLVRQLQSAGVAVKVLLVTARRSAPELPWQHVDPKEIAAGRINRL